jgi:hypothetical protein
MHQRIQQLALSVLALAASMAAANANIVVNGSFEQHDALNGSGWNYFYGNPGNQVPGWSSTSSSIPLEVGRATVYGVTGQAGLDVMELDSTRNVAATQVLATPGGLLDFSFLYAGRAGHLATSTFSVYWNNNLVANFAPNSTVMTTYSGQLTSIGNNTLQFVGTGSSDSYGALIDNVSLTPVPEPSTYVAGVLLLLPVVVQGIRARRNRA